MRKQYIISFFLIVVTSFFSCKKGDNDPFLSLTSRKARMHGNWELSGLDYLEKTTTADGDYVEVVETYKDQVITKITTHHTEISGATEKDTSTIQIDNVVYSFNKEGTWSREFSAVETWTKLDQNGQVLLYDTVVTTIAIKETGDWSFLGEVKGEYKNKERIVMNVLYSEKLSQITSSSTQISIDDTVRIVNHGDQTYDISNFYSGEESTIIELDELRKKEMVFIEKRQQSGSLTITPYQGITTTSEDDMFISDLKMTLIRK